MEELEFKSCQSDCRIHAFCSIVSLLTAPFASTSLSNFYSSVKCDLKNRSLQGTCSYHPYFSSAPSFTRQPQPQGHKKAATAPSHPLPGLSLSSPAQIAWHLLACWDHMPIPGPIAVAREMQFSDWPGLSHMSTSGTRVGMNTTQTHSLGMRQGGQSTAFRR